MKVSASASPSTRSIRSNKSGKLNLFRRNSSDFELSLQSGSFNYEKPKEVMPVEELINYLTKNIDALKGPDPDLSEFEELTAEVLMISHDPQLLRIAKDHGWTGSRYYASPGNPMEADYYLQALSNFYLKKMNTQVFSIDLSQSFMQPGTKGDINTKILDQILPYCPDLLVEFLKENPEKKTSSEARCITFNGACMLADISGFSKFSGAMCSKGVSGLDDLREATNGFLGHFVKTVYEYDGDVIAFAGDALVCVFPDTSGTRSLTEVDGKLIDDCCYRALQCACQLRTHQAKSLSTHIGVSCGEMKLALLGGLQDQWVYLMNGKCVCDLAGCITDAGPQQVAATLETYQSAVAWVSYLRQTVATTASIEVLNFTADNNVLINSMYDPAPVDGMPSSYQPYTHAGFKKSPTIMSSKSLVEAVSCFVPKPVLMAVNSESLEHIGELRSVTTMFLSLDSYSPELHQDPVTLQPFFLMAQAALVESGGFLRQFLVDDKGCVFIAMWGTPGFTYSNNCSRALFCAVSISQKCAQLSHKVSIGITTGIVYCSTVGAGQRRDYAGIGTDVNMAARLMSKAHGRVLLDNLTYSNLSQENKELLTLAEQMKLKGMEQPMTPWQFESSDKMPRMAGPDEQASEHSTIVKKKVKMCIGEQLDKLTTAQNSKSVHNLDDVSNEGSHKGSAKEAFFTLILGMPGTGKTVTATYFRHHARKRGIQCIFIQAHSEHKGLPYGLMRQLFLELVGPDNFATHQQQMAVIQSLVDQIAHTNADKPSMRQSLEMVLGLQLSEDVTDRESDGNMSNISFMSDSSEDLNKWRPEKSVTRKVSAAIFYKVLAVLLKNTPTVLIVENAHFCDELSWNELHIIQRGDALNIVVLITMLSSSAIKFVGQNTADEAPEAPESPVVESLNMTIHRKISDPELLAPPSELSREAAAQLNPGLLPPDISIPKSPLNSDSGSTAASSNAPTPVNAADTSASATHSHRDNLTRDHSTASSNYSVDSHPDTSPATDATNGEGPRLNGSDFPSVKLPKKKSSKRDNSERGDRGGGPRSMSKSNSRESPSMRPTMTQFSTKHNASLSVSPRFGRDQSQGAVSPLAMDAMKYGLKYLPTSSCIAIMENSKSTILEMTSLNDSEVTAILTHTLHVQTISTVLVKLVMDVCSGNAFWCKAIANFIKERGIEVFEETIKQGANPHTALKVLVLCRMEKLKPGPQIILKHAAIIGNEFSEKQLAAVVPGRYLSKLAGHLEFLCEHGFILCIEEFPEHKFSFQNQLIHDTIYELMPPKEAASLHLIVAEYIEVKYGDNLRPYYSRLAYHYARCGSEMQHLAFKFELKAADQALSRGAFNDGLAFTKTALKLADETAEYQILLEVIDGAIAEMQNAARASAPSPSSASKSLMKITASFQPIIAGENSTLNEYTKLKKSTEGNLVRIRKLEIAENGRAAKIAMLKNNTSAQLNWQPSYIASKRETLYARPSDIDELRNNEGEKPPGGCCVIS